MAESQEDFTDYQIEATIEEFNVRALRQPDDNSVLDATEDAAVRYANIYRDYISKRVVRQYLDPRPTDVVLDFGCGIGRLSKYLSPAVKSVEGTDRAEEMIKVAQKESPPNVHYCYTPSHALPYEANHFHKVLTYGVLQHINDEELGKVLNEIHRVLKPSGKFVCFEQTRKQSRWFGQVQFHRTVEDYVQLFNAANFKMLKAEPAVRFPSYAMSLWNRFSFVPSQLFLPFLAIVERKTLKRKPEFAEYYTTAFVCEK